MEKKYGVEDRILLRDDLEVGGVYGGVPFLKEMEPSIGQDFVVIDVLDNGYILRACGNYIYSDEMIKCRIYRI